MRGVTVKVIRSEVRASPNALCWLIIPDRTAREVGAFGSGRGRFAGDFAFAPMNQEVVA